MNRTVERTLAILKIIANSEHGITLQEIANQMDMAKSSAFAIVHTLLELNYISTVENNDKKYCLGVETFALGMKYANNQSLVQQCAIHLPALAEKAKQTNLPEDAQAANDLASLCSRFEKKLHDLELTRMLSIQMAPQIRLVQSNDTLMSEKIQSTLVNTIPLWKSQMVLALGIAHSTEAAQAQRQVTDFTNELLKKNAETLHLASVETAKESQRGIVDIETLKKNQSGTDPDTG